MRVKLMIVLTVAILVVAVWAFSEGQLQIWAKVQGVPNYGIGLPEDIYGVHPMSRETYGEGYFFLGAFEDGSYSFANVFLTNLGPGDNKGNFDVSIVEPNGQVYFARSELKSDGVQAATGQMDVRIGQNRAWGRSPNFNIKINEQKVNLDLKYNAVLPGFAINSGRVLYGNPEDYYSSYILIPRAEVSGTISTPGGARSVKGYGYSDHGVVTMMPHKYSKRWFSLRCFDKNYTLNILEFTTPAEWGGRAVPMIMLAKDKQLLYYGTQYTLTPSQWQTDAKTGIKWPQHFDFSIDRPGKIKITGGYTVQRQIEYLDIISKLNFLERQVAGFFAKSYVFRFAVKVNGEVTYPDGHTEKFEAPGVSEVLQTS